MRKNGLLANKEILSLKRAEERPPIPAKDIMTK